MYKQLTQQITNNTKTKKRGKSLFITGLPRYYRFMLFANYYSSTAACAAATRAIGTRNGEQET
jgi:hypothetical protein